PANALISNTATQSIGGYHLGTGSEIITAKPGALFSGEKAEGRGLETELNKFSNRRFIAGHLVAGSLGGKFSDPNLTPLSETFNTEKTGMADPENEGRRRLANNEVIHYATHVTYGNAQRQDWSAVLPTSLTVTISTLRVHDPENDDESELKNYTIPSKTQTYPRNNLPPL
ncbi:hypothetical protein, partial [Herbaspirillum sp. RV1423]|uniref:hypothetical protein n=1 Tax=Herbaspirillum sp. RV1423 TaxID=1443993 RepID=UPI000554BE27